MEKNNLFSLSRFCLLCRQSWIINKKMIGLSLTGYAGVLFIFLILIQGLDHFRQWDFQAYFGIFAFMFLILGVGIASSAFPAFRSKEMSMFYLMLPSSTLEKYFLEFLVHVIGVIILMPVLFILVAYIESFLIHVIVPDFERFSFSGTTLHHFFTFDLKPNSFKSFQFAILKSVFFILPVFFAGASHFSKSPLLKTILSGMIISVGFSFYSYFLKQFFQINKYRGLLGEVINKGIWIYLLIILLFVIAYFKLKEKEV